jgi:indolepyruvate ferredoxin oxidoreductase
VSRVIVTSDDPHRHEASAFPVGVDVWHRDRIDEAARVLAGTKGVTVLIHDQACAAELRRARSRGTAETPGFRVVINERVCEGCGDCGDKSNCLSVQPIDTPYGRKTRIHQTSCNFDFSCMKGDCPAFATVTVEEQPPIKVATPSAAPGPRPPADLPDPRAPLVDPDAFTLRLNGIGGTGVITVSQILGTAAMLADLEVRGLDQTGLSQKAGPVVSDLCITTGAIPASNHANASGVDCIVSFDLLVGASDNNLLGARSDSTVLVASTDAVPTGEMVTHPDRSLPPGNELLERVGEVTRRDANVYLDAAAISRGLTGSTTTANILLIGAAVQAGAIPLPVEAIERAIELNGVAVERNLDAFRWGRAWVEDPVAVEAAADIAPTPPPETLDELVDRLAADLVDYQNERYAERFRKVVSTARAAEQRIGAERSEFTVAVARNLHKLMAYKDEYEVARLLLLDESQAQYRGVGGDDTTVTYHLHPPMLRAMGLDRKIGMKRTALPAMRALRAAKSVRGTPLDPFRWAEVRRLERAMIPEYIDAVRTLSERLSEDNLGESIAIASLPDRVRGYEDLKVRRATEYRKELARRLG